MGIFSSIGHGITSVGGKVIHVGSDFGTGAGHLASATGHLVTGDTSGALSRYKSAARDLKSSTVTAGNVAGTVGKTAYESTGFGYGIDYELSKLGAGAYAPGNLIKDVGTQLGGDVANAIDAPEGAVTSGIDLAHGHYKKAALEGMLAGMSVVSVAQDMTPTGLLVNTALEQTPAGRAVMKQIVEHTTGAMSYIIDPKTGGKIDIAIGKDKNGNPTYTWKMSENDLEEARRRELIKKIVAVFVVFIVMLLIVLMV